MRDAHFAAVFPWRPTLLLAHLSPRGHAFFGPRVLNTPVVAVTAARTAVVPPS
jgi:hypothetical protein